MSDDKPIIFETIADMPEIVVSEASMLWNHTGSWRFMKPAYQNKVPPCNQGCPAGNDVEQFISLIGEKKYAEAKAVLKEENPFPRVCGRVCYHPCETACNRSKFDSPTAINALERFVGDFADGASPKPVRPPTQKTVAVVGSGPAGLTAAYHLARMGHTVTVFEGKEKAGGLLRYGIPAYRLGDDVLDSEIADIEALGVKIQCGRQVGKDLPFEELKKHDAVFIGAGVHQSQKLGAPGEDAKGVMSGLEFLARVNGGERPALGKKVIVIGGGNSAVDAARCALRLGADVALYYRRSRVEMPAFEAEVDEAEAEGVAINILGAPVKIKVDVGKVVGLTLNKMILGEPDESGRRRPEPIPGSEFDVEADTVITAIGEKSDFDFLPDGIKLEWGKIAIDEFGLTSHPGVFAGGDIALSTQNVAYAIGSGKKAAVAIDRFLAGEKMDEIGDRILIGGEGPVSISRYLATGDAHAKNDAFQTVVSYEELNLNYFDESERSKRIHLDKAARLAGFDEVNAGLTEAEAMHEAERCFHCGVCTMCDNCYVYCPDVAIRQKDDGMGYDIDFDYCKGCGICFKECPRSAMILEDE